MTGSTIMPRDSGGLARVRARQRRYWLLMGAALLILLIDGLFMWYAGILPSAFVHPDPAFTVGLVSGYGVGVGLGAYFMWRNGCDEHERRARAFGMVVGFTAYLLIVPPWAALAQAGLAPPVNNLVLWPATFALYLAAYGWRKYG